MKTLVVYKKSEFELYSNSPDEKVLGTLAKNEEYTSKLRASHKNQKVALDEVLSALGRLGINSEVIYRADLEKADGSDLVSGKDLIIAVGGDGTFMEVARYVVDTPLLGVNSDVGVSVGYYSCATKENIEGMLRNIHDVPITKVSRMKVVKDGVEMPLPILNEISMGHVCWAKPTKYHLKVDGEWIRKKNGQKDNFKRSGLAVCTASGSTALMYGLKGEVMDLKSKLLQYKGKEDRGRLHGYGSEIEIYSLTREGIAYIDGGHLHFPFGLGSKIVLTEGVPLNIVGDLESKRKGFH